MNNIARANEIYKLANKVEGHKNRIKGLKERFSRFVNGDSATITLSCYFNQDVHIEADEDLIDFLVLAEEGRLEIAEQELNELLNGDLNRVKACLEGIKNEEI